MEFLVTAVVTGFAGAFIWCAARAGWRDGLVMGAFSALLALAMATVVWLVWWGVQ